MLQNQSQHRAVPPWSLKKPLKTSIGPVGQLLRSQAARTQPEGYSSSMLTKMGSLSIGAG